MPSSLSGNQSGPTLYLPCHTTSTISVYVSQANDGTGPMPNRLTHSTLNHHSIAEHPYNISTLLASSFSNQELLHSTAHLLRATSTSRSTIKRDNTPGPCVPENPLLENCSPHNLLAYAKHLADRALPLHKSSPTDDPCLATSGPSDNEALDPHHGPTLVKTLVSAQYKQVANHIWLVWTTLLEKYHIICWVPSSPLLSLPVLLINPLDFIASANVYLRAQRENGH